MTRVLFGSDGATVIFDDAAPETRRVLSGADILALLADDKVVDDGMLCHCELSGEVHVVTSESCCEVCVISNLVPLTAENVARALAFTKAASSAGSGTSIRKVHDLFSGKKP